MTNQEIALMLKEISELLELKDENYFKIRAYRQAARQLNGLEEDLTRMVQKNRLKEIPGIGESIEKEIVALVRTGNSEVLEQLRSEVPPGLRRIVGLPGVGAKSAQKIYHALNVSSLNELRQACENDEIKQIPGFGDKFQQKVLEGINKLESTISTTLLGVALPMGNRLVQDISNFPEVREVKLSGSVRRKKEVVRDIDILISTQSPEIVSQKIIALPIVYQVLEEKDAWLSVLNTVGIKIDFYFTAASAYVPQLLMMTGSDAHIEKLKREAEGAGIIFESGGFYNHNQEPINLSDEKQAYQTIGMTYIPPEMREDKGEIEAAKIDDLPPLVERMDLKGDLHLHSHWSDGANTIEEMVKAAKALNHQYIAVTDHSKSLRVASGLKEAQLKKQIDEIVHLNHELEDFLIFTGIEVDILQEGRLDFSDEILSQLDFVIASVHQWMNEPVEVMTARICTAMENPYVKAIAHPTGRILGQRPENNLHLDCIFEKAVHTGTALEINATIDRLDLPEKYLEKADAYGVQFLINSDAHGTYALSDVDFGIYVARRAWLSSDKIINTKDGQAFNKWLQS